MRKPFSIICIILLLMNVLGYYGVFLGLEIRNDAQMVKRLDVDDFKADQIVTLKIPIAIPYAANSSNYERVDGKFEHKGEVYRLLKQKLANDTLTIVCVHDTEAKKINDAFTAYTKTLSDNQASDHSGKIVLSITKDYLPESFQLNRASESWQEEVAINTFTKNFISTYTVDVVHPPERL